MSGPKCNEYVLNEQRRLEEQRRIEEQLRLEEQRRIEEQRIEEKKRKKEIINAGMEEQRQKLRERLYRERERKLVAEAMDEAMVDMGYNLIATIEPKKEVEVPVKAQVYSFSEGVGIQVIDSAGRISMEVVGLGTNNRMPTEDEKAYLETQMEEFCTSFAKLEKILYKKGLVKSAAIHHYPPNRKYARILNLENFTQVEETETLQTTLQDKKKRKQQEVLTNKQKQKAKGVL